MLPVKHTIFFFIDFFHINFPSRFLYMRQAIRVFPFAADANSMAVSIYCSIEWVVSLSQQWLNGCACVCVCVCVCVPLSSVVFAALTPSLALCLFGYRAKCSFEVSSQALFAPPSMDHFDRFDGCHFRKCFDATNGRFSPLILLEWNGSLFTRISIVALISTTFSRKDFKYRSRLISNFEQNRTTVNVNLTLTWKKLNHFFWILK